MSVGEDVLFATVTDLSQRIRRRELSPVALTEAYLERIRRWNPRLNAYAHVTPDLAMAQARAAEDEIRRGKWRGPLHGIPYGAKDLFDTAGVPTEWGAAPTRGRTPKDDATVIRKLRDAGAILLGKVAMVEFAGGLGYRFANASSSGPGRNPWNPQRWTGGSSSGSGAAVAGGLAAFALGTETWGSILCPAAFCGLTGVRPTYGRVSRTGAMACAWTFDKVGPLARSAADCRLVLQAIAGHDPADPTSSREPVRLTPGSSRSRSVRAALITVDFSKGKEPAARAEFDRGVSVLREIGLELDDATLPDFPAAEVAGLLITVEALSSFEKFFADGSVQQLTDVYAPHQREIAAAVTGADVVKAWRMRRVLQERMAQFFADYDVIVTPNFITQAPPVDRDLNDTLTGYTDPVGAVGNACGLPAIALPTALGADRLPLGLQIVAAPFKEALLLDLGEQFQRKAGVGTARAVMVD